MTTYRRQVAEIRVVQVLENIGGTDGIGRFLIVDIFAGLKAKMKSPT